MAKSSTPIRIDQDLMERAKVIGRAFSRSSAQQLEHWADIGRAIESNLSVNDLLAIKMGVLQVRVETVRPDSTASTRTVMSNFRAKQKSGKLKENILSEGIRYQASGIPGKLDQVHPDGTILTGQFKDGQFVQD